MNKLNKGGIDRVMKDKTVWYLLRQPVLWYKTGTAFSYDKNNRLWICEPGDRAVRTLDNLQNAIAEHIKDEDSEEYFTRLEL